MTKNGARTPVYLDPGMHPGLEVKGLTIDCASMLSSCVSTILCECCLHWPLVTQYQYIVRYNFILSHNTYILFFYVIIIYVYIYFYRIKSMHTIEPYLYYLGFSV